MKKNVWIYAAAGAVLAMTMAGSFILGTAMNFQGITFPVSLFIPFVVYIVMETYLCDKFGLRQLIFALSVIGGSFLALLLILFLSALLTRSFDILSFGWKGDSSRTGRRAPAAERRRRRRGPGREPAPNHHPHRPGSRQCRSQG